MLLILPVFFIYSDKINKYEPGLIILLKNGRESGQIWYDKYGLPHHTRAFTISKKENVYVCDPYNGRIQVYDIHYNYKKSIKNNKLAADGVAFADKVIIDNYENLIIIDHSEGLYKYTDNGERLLKISRSELPDSLLYSLHYYPFNDYIAFYNSEKELCLINKDGIITIPPMGDHLFNIDELKESENLVENKMYNYIVEHGLLYIDNKIFPKNYYDFCSLRSAVKEEIRALQKKVKKGITDVSPAPDIFIDQLLIGYDNDNNIYWQGYWKKLTTRAIAVFSNDLILLDLFTYELESKEDTYEAITPNGDIYIMQPEPEGVYFYKITRRW